MAGSNSEIRLFQGLNEVQVEWNEFPDKQIQPKIAIGVFNTKSPLSTYLTVSIVDSQGVVGLMQLLGLLRRFGLPLEVNVLYWYGARSDKTVDDQNILFPTTFLLEDIFNMYGVKTVRTLDKHSWLPRSKGVNLKPLPLHDLAQLTQEADLLVFPDASAYNRYREYAKDRCYIIFEKTRDQVTGEITGHKVQSYQGADLARLSDPNKILVIDDLCDGGATFISVAKMLRQTYADAGLELYITHGVFSKGVGVLLDDYDVVHVTNSYRPGRFNPDSMRVKMYNVQPPRLDKPEEKGV